MILYPALDDDDGDDDDDDDVFGSVRRTLHPTVLACLPR